MTDQVFTDQIMIQTAPGVRKPLADCTAEDLQAAAALIDQTPDDAPTPPPCPSWCVLESGHGYDSVLTAHPATYMRFHELQIGATGGGGPRVMVTAEERADSVTGEMVVAEPVVTVFVSDGEADLDGDQASELAKHLFMAEQEWNRIRRNS